MKTEDLKTFFHQWESETALLESCAFFEEIDEYKFYGLDYGPEISISNNASPKKLAFETQDKRVLVKGVGKISVSAPLKNIPVFTARSFEQGDFEGNWKGFTQDIFTPRLFSLTRDSKTQFVISLDKNLSFSKNIDELFELLNNNRESTAPPLFSKTDLIPQRDEWKKRMNDLLSALKNNKVEKVVLSRDLVKKFDRNLSPEDFYKTEKSSYNLFWQVNETTGFVSHTPECLFKISNNKMTLDVLAGTRPRGKTSQEDELLKNELLNSEKDLEEHRIVARDIIARLKSIGLSPKQIETEEVLALKHVFHLKGTIEAELPSNFPLFSQVGKVIELIHPTPAMGGLPREKAKEIITQLEKRSRGLYAAPFGMILGDHADFCVGIRSCLIKNNEQHIFGGAGIIDGSDEESEWNETGRKMWHFLDERERS